MRQEKSWAVPPDRLAMALGWFSIGLGLAEVAAPRTMARLTGLPEDTSLNTLRAFGAREIGNGVAILAQPDRAAWLWSRVGGDAVDVSYLARALSSDEADRDRVMGAMAAVLGVTALDVICAMQLNRQDADAPAARAARRSASAVKVERVTTINKPVEEVYQFWKNFENLPRFMRHLQSVQKLDERRSRWRARGPAGMTVEWEAEILQDRRNEWIAWRSIAGSDIDTSGSVRFSPAPGARGTEVRVQLQYTPPAGSVGRIVAKLFGAEPDQQVHEDLHRFKQLMETGEIPLSDGLSLWRAAQPAAEPNEIRTLAGVSS